MAAELVSIPRLRDAADIMQWSRELVDTLQRVFSGQVSGLSIDIHALKAGATTWALQEVQQVATVPLPNNVWTPVASALVDLTSLTLGEQSGVIMFGFTDVTTYVNTANAPIITSSLFIDNVEFSRQQQAFGQLSRYTLSQGGMKFLDPGLHTLEFRLNANWNGNTGGVIQADLNKLMFVALR
jgi:hypothetical protein